MSRNKYCYGALQYLLCTLSITCLVIIWFKFDIQIIMLIAITIVETLTYSSIIICKKASIAILN